MGKKPTKKRDSMRPTEKSAYRGALNVRNTTQSNVHNKPIRIVHVHLDEDIFPDDPLSGKYRVNLPDGWYIVVYRVKKRFTGGIEKIYWQAKFVPPKKMKEHRTPHEKMCDKKRLETIVLSPTTHRDALTRILAERVFYNRDMNCWESYHSLSHKLWFAMPDENKIPPTTSKRLIVQQLPTQMYVDSLQKSGYRSPTR